MDKPIKCVPCGTIVRAVYGNIEGMVTCISIRFGRVSYEVSYFNNGDSKTVWMHESEFSAVNERISVGFNKKAAHF